MTTWFLKECPKCGGDLYLDRCSSDERLKCLQCGWDFKLPFLLVDESSEKQTSPDLKAAGSRV